MLVGVPVKSRLVVCTPHARVWGAAIFGGLFLASYLAVSDEHPPFPGTDDPLGVVVCLATLALAVRSARLGLTIRPGLLVVRGYFVTRRVPTAAIESVSVIDYPGPWWLDAERLKGLRLDLTGRRPLTVWGVTGSMRRVSAARRRVCDGLRDLGGVRQHG